MYKRQGQDRLFGGADDDFIVALDGVRDYVNGGSNDLSGDSCEVDLVSPVDQVVNCEF